MERKSSVRCFGGDQSAFTHKSTSLSCDMVFSVFTPPGDGPFPVLYFLSGLTCTDENFTVKAGAQRVASELGVMLVAPDTSPRGDDVPDDPEGAYDFGLGAGFYVDAIAEPWSKHYQMYSYITDELPALVGANLPVDTSRVGITGHSMGGHGALTIALKNPEQYRSVSAFAPIVSPLNCPWGEKALSSYLGPDRGAWRQYDSCALIDDGARVKDILVDQGADDTFLKSQLMPERLEKACSEAGIPLTLNMREGYDHSYFFIASFIEDHLRWHADRLAA